MKPLPKLTAAALAALLVLGCEPAPGAEQRDAAAVYGAPDCVRLIRVRDCDYVYAALVTGDGAFMSSALTLTHAADCRNPAHQVKP